MEVPNWLILVLVAPLLLIGIGLVIGIFWDYLKAGFSWGKNIAKKIWRKHDNPK